MLAKVATFVVSRCSSRHDRTSVVLKLPIIGFSDLTTAVERLVSERAEQSRPATISKVIYIY